MRRPEVFLLLMLVLLSGTACVSRFSTNQVGPADSKDFVADYYKAMAFYENQDYVNALSAFKALAIQGDDLAQLYVGNMYERGEGVAQDDVEAMRWYRMAAEQGYVDAQLNMAEMCSNGMGTPTDYVQAYAWWTLAADQGDDSAVNSRALIVSRMTADQVLAAEQLVQVWRHKK